MSGIKPSVDIIIPNWNGKDLLEACLASIDRQTYRQYAVIVVDNGSRDGSVDMVRDSHPDVQLVCFSSNLGFCHAVNAGIQLGRSPFIFLLNNDTELAPDCLEVLVRAAEDNEDAFFSPKMLNFNQRDVLDGAGEGFLRGGVGYRLGTMEKDSPVYNKAGWVFGACGGAAFYRRQLFENIGLFDEDFFAYLEDVDLNFRANKAGFTCRYVPEARVYHVGSATTGSKINPFTVRLSTRNNFSVIVQNYSLFMFLRFLPAIFVYQFFWLLFVIKKRSFLPYLAGIWLFFRALPVVCKKRSNIRSSTGGISHSDLTKRILKAERAVVDSIMRRRQSSGKGNMLLRMYGRIFL